MGVDGFAEAWGVRKSRQGANWRAVVLFSAQTTYFCQTSCLTHTHTQCAFTVCYSVTAVTLGIFSSCSLCCQTHTPWSSKTGLYRLQPVADCKADLLSVVMLLPHDFFFFSWNLNYSTGIPLKMDLCTTLQIFLFPALWHHKTHHLHLFKHLIFTG